MLLTDGGGQKGPHLSLKSVSDILSATIILYLKKIKKIYKSRDTPLSFADISIFSLKIINFCYIKKYGCILHFNTQFLILLFFFFKTFFESLKVALINTITILMMLAKLAILGLLEIWNKGFNVIMLVLDLTKKVFSHDSSYTVDVVKWKSCTLRVRIRNYSESECVKIRTIITRNTDTFHAVAASPYEYFTLRHYHANIKLAFYTADLRCNSLNISN